MSDSSQGALKPVPPARVAEELRRLTEARSSGGLERDEYEHRFSRMISELRDRRIDGSRAEIMAALTPLRDSGAIAPPEFERLIQQLGLA